jgi:hypothetical protein
MISTLYADRQKCSNCNRTINSGSTCWVLEIGEPDNTVKEYIVCSKKCGVLYADSINAG